MGWYFSEVVLDEIQKSGKIDFMILDDDIPECVMQYYLCTIIDDNDNKFEFYTEESVYALKGFLAEQKIKIDIKPMASRVTFYREVNVEF